MPDIIPVTSPPSPIATTQTNQHLFTMDADEGLEDNSIASTNPFRMAIPKPRANLLDFWAWVETKFPPFYSKELYQVLLFQLNLDSFQEMEEFFNHKPHRTMIEQLGFEQFLEFCQPLIELAVIWNFAQNMDSHTTVTYGDFISFRDQRSKTYQLCFPRAPSTPPPYSKVSTTVAASADDFNTQHSKNQRPNAPAMITEEGKPYLSPKDGSQHSWNSRRSKRSYSRSQNSHYHEFDSVSSRHST